MTGNHWTDDEMLEFLYSGGDSTHVDECGLCGERWRQLLERRKVVVAADDPVPAEMLRAQRAAIHRAIAASSEPRRVGLRALIGSAAATAAVAGLLLYVPGTRAPSPAVQRPAVSDTQLFAEISSELEDPAPRAVAPMRALFAEEQQQ